MPPSSSKHFFRTLFLCTLLASVSSCARKRLAEDLTAETERIARETVEVYDQPLGQSMTLSWDEAVERLEAHSLDLRRSRRAAQNARRRLETQWRTWLPQPSASIAFRKALNNFGDLESDDIDANIFSAIRIPNPVREYGQLMSLGLTAVQSEDSFQLAYRQQVLTLHRLFQQYEELQKQDEAQTAATSNAQEVISQKLRAIAREEAKTQRKALLQNQLARLLNLPNTKIVLKTARLPRPDYAQRILRLKPGENYGKLAIRLAAYQVHAAVLRARGVAIQGLPNVTFSTSLPALVDTRRESSTVLEDFGSIRFFSSLNKTYDFTGQAAFNKRSAKEDLKVVRETLRLDLHEEAQQWESAKRQAKLLRQRESLTQKRLAMLRENPELFTGGEKSLDESRRLINELRQIELARSQLNSQIWLWDDAAWPVIPIGDWRKQ